MNVREERAAVAARRRFEARELLERLKSGPCQDCNNPDLMPCQKDLIRPDGKTEQLSKRLLMSQERILLIAEKCRLVCANCGRLRVWKAQRARRAGLT
jgi:predicted RNA-binding Zn-ribbon protein involved in translation (DUF1610 family)